MSDGIYLDDEILACFLAKLDADPALPADLRARVRELLASEALPTPAALAAALRGEEPADGEAPDAH